MSTDPGRARLPLVLLALLSLVPAPGWAAPDMAPGPLLAANAWTGLQPGQPLPWVRREHSGAYDVENDRLVVFGGEPGCCQPGLMNDTWLLTPGGGWTQVATETQPAARRGAGAVYDPIRKRMVLFGGLAESAFADVWALDLSGTPQWTQLSPSGSPGARSHFAAVYDSRRDRMVVFGGYPTFADVWALDFSPTPSWSRLDSGGMNWRWGHVAVYDSVADRMVVFGGWGTNTNDVHAFDFSTNQWTSVAVDPALLPPVLRGAAAALDPVTNSLIIHGGMVGAGNSDDLWSLSLSGPMPAWRLQSNGVGGPSPRRFHTAAYRPAASELVVFGGFDDSGSTFLNDAWVYLLPSAPDDPSPRIVSVRDVPLDQGGRVFVAWEASDLDNVSDAAITSYRVWRRVPVALAADRARSVVLEAGPDGFWENVAEIPAAFLSGYGHVATTVSDSMAGGNPYAAFVIQALTAQWNIFYWSEVDSGYSIDNLAPDTPSPFVANVVEGGVDLHWGASPVADLGVYSIHRGGSPDFAPSEANRIAMVPDTGYTDAQGAFGMYYKVAAVDVHGNASPYALAYADRPVGTLASLAGVSLTDAGMRLEWRVAAQFEGSLWRLERLGSQAWEQIGEGVAEAGVVRFLDPDARAGAQRYRLSVPADGISLEYVVEVPGVELAVRGVWPNPIHGGSARIRVSLPGDSPARLELLDVSGRRIAARGLAGLGAGEHPIEVTGLPKLPAGMVFVRLTQGSRYVTAKLAVVQ